MRRILIAVEGQTEERFAKYVLAQHLRSRGIEPVPTILRTKVLREGGSFKGGLTRFRQADERVRALLRDSEAILVTTMFDYCGPWREDFLANYRSGKELRGTTTKERVKELEKEMEAHFNAMRFRAFLTLHEFEGLLFSKPEEIAAVLNQPEAKSRLREIRAEFPTPEDINDRPDCAPSKRLMEIVEGYQKPAHGSLIAGRIGLEVIRRECSHFNEWLSGLETLGE